MSLFKGRDDLYAKRWESSNGRSGYTPVCVNEWKPAFCRKTEVKCAVCGHRTYGVLDEKFIEAHLRGNLVAGIYPLRQDETCHFLAIDFDKDGWQQDVSTLGDVCTALAVPMAIERNRQTGETSGPVQNVGDLTQKSFIAEFGTGCRTFDGFGRNSWGVDIVGTHEQIKEGHKNLQAVPQPAQLSILPTISGSHPMFKACQLLGALVCSKVKCTAPGYMDKFGFECSSAVATWFATLTLMVERRTG
ncbi:MAG TPA: hypothetical protein DCZ69_13600 [Syntrophobacteraceae bacterium]|nr:hypothetical protein [Syntrophobacteraceae bacterium]